LENLPPNNFLYSAYKIEAVYSDGVKSIGRKATGFILEISNNKPWIITNRHVIDLNYKEPTQKYFGFKLIDLLISGRYPDDTTYTLQISTNASFYFHDKFENDVVIIEALGKPNTIKLYWHFVLRHLANNAEYIEIFPFDLICFTGFPFPHDQFAGRPILRAGRISSDPKFEYSWNKESQGQCVAYEGFSSEGASGSPVFALSRGISGMPGARQGYLIGINAGHIPSTTGHSGISYFYKSIVIHEIIEKHGLKKLM